MLVHHLDDVLKRSIAMLVCSPRRVFEHLAAVKLGDRMKVVRRNALKLPEEAIELVPDPLHLAGRNYDSGETGNVRVRATTLIHREQLDVLPSEFFAHPFVNVSHAVCSFSPASSPLFASALLVGTPSRTPRVHSDLG
jgi:hypothetical protein